jgi:hypothetical protein
MLSVDPSMTGRDYDFEELRPLGEASRTPDHQLDERSNADPRRQRRASVETGYPEHQTDDKAECRSCGAPIPASQTKCRFCLTNHLGDSDTATTETGQEATLEGIVFALVESSTFYGAVAKGAAAGNLFGASEIEDITEHRLIYDLTEEPASQLVDQWPSLPDATKVTSEIGDELLTAIRERVGGQEHSTFAGAQEDRACLYDERGEPLRAESRLDTMLETADDPMWLVPGIALQESSGESDQDAQPSNIPTRVQLECHHCDSETGHRFTTYESLPDDTWSGQPIWECRECGTCRYGPEPQ